MDNMSREGYLTLLVFFRTPLSWQELYMSTLFLELYSTVVDTGYLEKLR